MKAYNTYKFILLNIASILILCLIFGLYIEVERICDDCGEVCFTEPIIYNLGGANNINYRHDYCTPEWSVPPTYYTPEWSVPPTGWRYPMKWPLN